MHSKLKQTLSRSARTRALHEHVQRSCQHCLCRHCLCSKTRNDLLPRAVLISDVYTEWSAPDQDDLSCGGCVVPLSVGAGDVVAGAGEPSTPACCTRSEIDFSSSSSRPPISSTATAQRGGRVGGQGSEHIYMTLHGLFRASKPLSGLQAPAYRVLRKQDSRNVVGTRAENTQVARARTSCQNVLRHALEP